MKVLVTGGTGGLGLAMASAPAAAAATVALTGRSGERASSVAADVAERLNSVLADPELADRMGKAGRRRAVEQFSWTTIAAETAALYAQLR